MMNFIVGYYVNQNGQQYSTVVVKVLNNPLLVSMDYALCVAVQEARNNELFRILETAPIYISQKEIDEMSEGDIWNQVSILDSKEYIQKVEKMIEQTLTNAVRFFPT